MLPSSLLITSFVLFLPLDPQQNDNDTNSDGSDVSEDEETSSFKPKIALEEEDDDDTNTEGIYHPPRHQAVPFELDNERALLKAERLLQKQRDRLSRSELTQVIKSQFTDAPEEEDVRGGALLGKQSEASRKLAQQDAAQQELEESHMIRFTVGKKEKKLRTKMRRDELSNLNVISGGFGTVGAGIDDAFGNDNDGSGDDMLSGVKRKKSRKSSGDRYTPQDGGEGSYKMKGMRKRKVEILNDGSSKRGGSGKKKKKGATNTYQKSLYGGRQDGSSMVMCVSMRRGNVTLYKLPWTDQFKINKVKRSMKKQNPSPNLLQSTSRIHTYLVALAM